MSSYIILCSLFIYFLPVFSDALLRYYDLKSVRGDLVKVICDSVTDITEKKKGEKLLKDGVIKL